MQNRNRIPTAPIALLAAALALAAPAYAQSTTIAVPPGTQVVVVPVPESSPAPCGDILCMQAKYNRDVGDLNVVGSHIQSLQADIVQMNSDIEKLDESSGHDNQIAADEAQIKQDRAGIIATQDKIAKIQSAINADQAAMR